jgi:hypothetical protein
MTGYSRAVKGFLSPLLGGNNQVSIINNQENPKSEYLNTHPSVEGPSVNSKYKIRISTNSE